ncbi:hypothetical protein FRX31_025847 [Thalictrum thalictroides]|uniref:Uncharacterized protein n=1 Tax=Thalictrum thalictroides TaxID=46969 RepID=A0A7J6VHI6_THATH|nr:hypothetical protein FRX31_025847 [Thalictrum thalictroides]
MEVDVQTPPLLQDCHTFSDVVEKGNEVSQWTPYSMGETAGRSSSYNASINGEGAWHENQQQRHEDQQQQHLHLPTAMIATTNDHGMGSEDQPACLLSFDQYQPTSPQDWNVPTIDDIFNELFPQTGEDQGQSAGFPFFDEYQQTPTEVWNI